MRILLSTCICLKQRVAVAAAAPGWGGARGFVAAEMIVGVGLALGVILGALSLARSTLILGNEVSERSEQSAAACWALDRMAGELARAGLGFGRDPACPDEAVELLTETAIVFRADLDADEPGAREVPEALLTGHFPIVSTANDEVVAYLLRTGTRGGQERALFEADLDAPGRVRLADGTPVARRDGLVEEIDAGPLAGPTETGPSAGGRLGTLYRVTFVHDARRAGTGRFRVAQPLLDRVRAFRVRAVDEIGHTLSPCGGADTPGARRCRARIRRIVLELEIDALPVVLRRELTPPALAGLR